MTGSIQGGGGVGDLHKLYDTQQTDAPKKGGAVETGGPVGKMVAAKQPQGSSTVSQTVSNGHKKPTGAPPKTMTAVTGQRRREVNPTRVKHARQDPIDQAKGRLAYRNQYMLNNLVKQLKAGGPQMGLNRRLVQRGNQQHVVWEAKPGGKTPISRLRAEIEPSANKILLSKSADTEATVIAANSLSLLNEMERMLTGQDTTPIELDSEDQALFDQIMAEAGGLDPAANTMTPMQEAGVDAAPDLIGDLKAEPKEVDDKQKGEEVAQRREDMEAVETAAVADDSVVMAEAAPTHQPRVNKQTAKSIQGRLDNIAEKLGNTNNAKITSENGRIKVTEGKTHRISMARVGRSDEAKAGLNSLAEDLEHLADTLGSDYNATTPEKLLGQINSIMENPNTAASLRNNPEIKARFEAVKEFVGGFSELESKVADLQQRVNSGDYTGINREIRALRPNYENFRPMGDVFDNIKAKAEGNMATANFQKEKAIVQGKGEFIQGLAAEVAALPDDAKAQLFKLQPGEQIQKLNQQLQGFSANMGSALEALAQTNQPTDAATRAIATANNTGELLGQLMSQIPKSNSEEYMGARSALKFGEDTAEFPSRQEVQKALTTLVNLLPSPGAMFVSEEFAAKHAEHSDTINALRPALGELQERMENVINGNGNDAEQLGAITQHIHDLELAFKQVSPPEFKTALARKIFSGLQSSAFARAQNKIENEGTEKASVSSKLVSAQMESFIKLCKY